MSCDLVPVIANLFKYCYQNETLLDTKDRDLPKVRLSSSMFCIIVDLGKMKNHLGFKNYNDIHPSELKVNKESILTSEA